MVILLCVVAPFSPHRLLVHNILYIRRKCAGLNHIMHVSLHSPLPCPGLPFPVLPCLCVQAQHHLARARKVDDEERALKEKLEGEKEALRLKQMEEQVCLSVFLSVCLSVRLSVCCLSVCLSVFLSAYLYICLCACLSVCLSVPTCVSKSGNSGKISTTGCDLSLQTCTYMLLCSLISDSSKCDLVLLIYCTLLWLSVCMSVSLPTFLPPSLPSFFLCPPLQREILRQKELQAQQLEEQRAQFKMRTQNLLQFREQSPEPRAKASRKKVQHMREER